MELYQLEYFRILCKHGNFTSASEELMVTQPAVSTAIKKLEDEYGVELIDRQTKVFTLTRTGETLLKHAVRIHNAVSDLNLDLNAAAKNRRELIRLGLPLTMCPELLPKLITDFAISHMDISLTLMQKGHAAIAEGLSRGSLDLGIINKDILNPLLLFKDLTKVELYAAFSPEHSFNKESSITPEMLATQTLVFSEVLKGMPAYVTRYLAENQIDPQKTYFNVFPDDSALLTRCGGGIALLPRHLAGEHSAPLLPSLYCDLVVAWNKKDILSAEKQALVDFLINTSL